uniref:Uncharacterized protein n=1 Tax=Kalanchoe fedtschenkoi TaxID=63787 RepID=A0A7N0V8R1_KALFE
MFFRLRLFITNSLANYRTFYSGLCETQWVDNHVSWGGFVLQINGTQDYIVGAIQKWILIFPLWISFNHQLSCIWFDRVNQDVSYLSLDLMTPSGS